MKRLIILIFASVFGLLSVQSFAQELQEESAYEYTEDEIQQGFGLGLGVKLSTFGPGVEIIAAINPTFQLRLGGTYFNYAYTHDDENLSSVSLLANFHLTRVFFLSGGLIYNMNEIGLNGFPNKTITIGVMEVQPEQIGSLDYRVKPGSSISPYAGIGIGRSLSKDNVVSFAVEFGAAFHGKPKVELSATGMLEPTG